MPLKASLSPLKYRVFYDFSVDFIFIVKVMIMDQINLYGVVVSSVKLHSSARQLQKERCLMRSDCGLRFVPSRKVLVSLLPWRGGRTPTLAFCPFYYLLSIGQQQGNCKVQNLTLICEKSVFPHSLHLPLYLWISQSGKNACSPAQWTATSRQSELELWSWQAQTGLRFLTQLVSQTTRAYRRSGGVTRESLFRRQV